MNVFKKIKAYLQFRQAIITAEDAHAKDGTRYWVMPYDRDNKPNLFIVNRQNFKILKRKGYIPKNATIGDLDRECFYVTAGTGNVEPLSPKDAEYKRRVFYRWYGLVSKRKQ
jgi:hypothetical protein